MEFVSEFKVFESDAYGKIGMAILNGSPWFVAKDVDAAMAKVGAGTIHCSGLRLNVARISASYHGKQVEMISCDGLIELMRHCYAYPDARGMGEWVRRCIIPESMEESYKFAKDLGVTADGSPVHCCESKKFGKLRALFKNGKIWLFLTDVLRGLRMQSPYYFRKNVPEKEQGKTRFDSIVLFVVSLRGYSIMVEASGKPSSTRDFRQWAKEEAIPMIAKSFAPEDKKEEEPAPYNTDGDFIELKDERFLSPVRFIADNGEVWFLARDIGKALGKVRRINEKISVAVPEEYKRHIKRTGGLSTLISVKALPALEKSIRRYNPDAYDWLAEAEVYYSGQNNNTVTEASTTTAKEIPAVAEVESTAAKETMLASLNSNSQSSIVQEQKILEWQGQPVLTSDQLAIQYGCKPNSLRQNFNAHKERFTEGKDFFSASGRELAILRRNFPWARISPKTRVITLWTKKGVCRHSKLINTDRAWEVYDRLEDTYFKVHEDPLSLVPENIRCFLQESLPAIIKEAVTEAVDHAVRRMLPARLNK